METLSNKAKIVYAAMEALGATNKENQVTAYTILDYIIEEGESLEENERLADIDNEEYVNITLEINIKAIATILTALAKKNIIIKTDPSTVTVDGERKQLRHYFIKK